MNTKVIKGLAAISIADAEKIGTVSRAFFDPEKMGIVGFVVELGRDKSTMPLLVKVDDVHSLGPDALMFDDKSAIKEQIAAERFDHLVDVDSLAKHKVVTEGGTFVGNVASFDFDETTFELQQVEASPGFFKTNKHVLPDQIVSIGNDLIIVDDAVALADASGRPDPKTTTPEGEPRFQRVVDGPAAAPVASPARPPVESPA